MKKSRLVTLTTLIISIIMQAFSFLNYPDLYYENGFAIGILNPNGSPEIAFQLIWVLMPIIFIMFFFNGTIQDITQGYGKLLIIRSYSKTKLLLKRLFKNSGLLLLIVLLQCLVFLFVNNSLMSVERGMFKSLIMYFIILHSIIMLQSFLELYTMVQNANIILIIYTFISYYIVLITEENKLTRIFLFPCLMFGMQNGAVNCDSVYYIYVAVGIVLNLLLMIFCVRKFKKTDIF